MRFSEIGSHDNEDEAYSYFFMGLGLFQMKNALYSAKPDLHKFFWASWQRGDHDGGDEEEKWLLTILLAVMMVGIGMLVEVVEMMMTMLMMLMMMMMIYIYDEMIVCHEKSSLPSFELSAGRAKWAAC